jgi:hypothetical protein
MLERSLERSRIESRYLPVGSRGPGYIARQHQRNVALSAQETGDSVEAIMHHGLLARAFGSWTLRHQTLSRTSIFYV